jgi:anthranilate 1,2-dioxygenase ferredoxin subunit
VTVWHDVGSLRDLEVRKRRAVEVEGRTIALFWIKGTVYALADTCIHEQRQLSKGAVLFGKVICPGHQWKFDPETGEAEGQGQCQPTYPVVVREDGTIAVGVNTSTAVAP